MQAPSRNLQNNPKERVLVIRLSSLGDIILTEYAAELLHQNDYTVDWLVSEKFFWLLDSNPKIKALVFDRSLPRKFRRWIRFFWDLSQHSPYSYIIDYQNTPRTFLAKIIFKIGQLFTKRSTKWLTLSKPRLSRFLYIALKRLLPNPLRPKAYSDRAIELLVKNGLIDAQLNPPKDLRAVQSKDQDLKIGIIPSSAWPAKEWPCEQYAALIDSLIQVGREVSVFGMKGSTNFDKLINRFEKAAAVSFISTHSRKDLEQALLQCEVVVGGDTGLLHVAERLGINVVMIYGPTTKSFGFGLRRSESVAIEADVWCSPCSKDGSFCFRFDHKYACMKGISKQRVLSAVESKTSKVP